MPAHRDAVTSLSIDSTGFLLASGGHDCSLRFWDLFRIEHSCVISGLHGDDTKPIFATASTPNYPGLALHVERVIKGGSTTGGADQKSGKSAKAASREKPPRHTVISAEQGQLLRSHLDSILDVAVLEMPYTMTVSVDRSGVIFVFQ